MWIIKETDPKKIAAVTKAIEEAMSKLKDDECYPMCKSQLVQVDCRISTCIYYAGGGNCSNVAPAITLNPDKTFVCWSEKDK